MSVGIRYLAASTIVAFAVIYFLNLSWGMGDMAAYDAAAQRLIHGQSLYPPLTDPTAPDVYRYAPWFAAVWIPMLALPEAVRTLVWAGILITAVVLAAWPLLTSRRLILTSVGILALGLGWGAHYGNLEPLMVALLVWGIPRRWGPLAVGVAASLKIAPILFVLVWLGRGEWRKAAIALAVATLLLAPMLLFDLSHYPIEATASLSLRKAFGTPIWLGALLLFAGLTLLAARRRWAWWPAALTVLAAYPQLPLYRLGVLLVPATIADKPRPAGQIFRPRTPRLNTASELHVPRAHRIGREATPSWTEITPQL